MKIRLGYVSLSKALNVTSSKTLTYTNFLNEEKPYEKLKQITKNNLDNLEQILIYNIKNNIHFYRLTSKLIPLATHKDVNFDYITPFIEKFNIIANLIKDNNLRIDTHPDQFCVLNSTNPDIVKNSIEILEYHYKILDLLGIKDKEIILHVGGNAFGKKKSMTRFINNFNNLPSYLQSSIVLENDDKVFNIDDVLYISKQINIPVVLDYHHYLCNKGEKEIEELIEDIFSTWKSTKPKIHFSSPKSKLKKEYRTHHDYINSEVFIEFIEKIKFIKKDFDIMIEAKAKDDALYRLVRELKYKTNYKFIDESSFII